MRCIYRINRFLLSMASLGLPSSPCRGPLSSYARLAPKRGNYCTRFMVAYLKAVRGPLRIIELRALLHVIIRFMLWVSITSNDISHKHRTSIGRFWRNIGVFFSPLSTRNTERLFIIRELNLVTILAIYKFISILSVKAADRLILWQDGEQ